MNFNRDQGLAFGETMPRPDPTAAIWAEMEADPSLDFGPARHPAFDRLMALIPPEICQSFSAEQLLALSVASIPRHSQHLVDYRANIRFFRRRFYVRLIAGRERRQWHRLNAHKKRRQPANVDGAVMMTSLVLGFVALLFGVYIVIAALGIDLFEGDAAMHDVFRQLDMQPTL